MKDRRALSLMSIVAVAAIVSAAVAIWQGGGPANAQAKLPEGVTLLDATTDATIRGQMMCGKCVLNLNPACNVAIWDRHNDHLVTVLPNERLEQLKKLMGT